MRAPTRPRGHARSTRRRPRPVEWSRRACGRPGSAVPSTRHRRRRTRRCGCRRGPAPMARARCRPATARSGWRGPARRSSRAARRRVRSSSRPAEAGERRRSRTPPRRRRPRPRARSRAPGRARASSWTPSRNASISPSTASWSPSHGRWSAPGSATTRAPGMPLAHVAARLAQYSSLAVEDERRDADGRQHGRTSISAFMSADLRDRRRARAADEVGRVPADRLLVARRSTAPARPGSAARDRRAPLLGGRAAASRPARPAPDRVVGRPAAARVGAHRDQRRRPLGIRGGEQRAPSARPRRRRSRRALGADGVHHRAHVVHPLLERRDPVHPVRQPGAALVEQDQPPDRARRR